MKSRLQLLFAQIVVKLALLLGWQPPRKPRPLQQYLSESYPPKSKAVGKIILNPSAVKLDGEPIKGVTGMFVMSSNPPSYLKAAYEKAIKEHGFATNSVTTIEKEILLGTNWIGGVDDPSVARISKYEKTGCIWEAPQCHDTPYEGGFAVVICAPRWAGEKAQRHNQTNDALYLLDCDPRRFEQSSIPGEENQS